MPEVKTSVVLSPWQVPNFATVAPKTGRRQDGIKEPASIPVADLDAEALDVLAFTWLEELYRKAGKHNPFAMIRSK